MSKEIVWFSGEVKAPPFSREARQRVGMLLRRLQDGERIGMPRSRSMSSIAKRVHELRVNSMDASKKARLRAAGISVGTVQEFLELTDAEVTLIEIKLDLARAIKHRRTRRKMTQKQLAALINSTQPRVVRLERADASLDMLTRTLVSLGATRTELSKLFAA